MHQNIQLQKVRRSMGGFCDLTGYQTLQPPRKYGWRMPPIETCQI